MVGQARVMAAAAVILLIIGVAVWNPFTENAHAQGTGYENYLLCQLPGATKAEAQLHTGVPPLFAESFVVKTRGWHWIASANMWHGEWWLRDPAGSGNFVWAPVATNMTCSFYPTTLDHSWIGTATSLP